MYCTQQRRAPTLTNTFFYRFCVYVVHILWFSGFWVLSQPRLQAIILNWCFKTCMDSFCTKLFIRLINHWRNGLISDNERERSKRTSALYILIRPWLTLDQEGTALMFHSWLECSANGPVFIYRTEKEWQKWGEEGQVRHIWCKSSTLYRQTVQDLSLMTKFQRKTEIGTGLHTIDYVGRITRKWSMFIIAYKQAQCMFQGRLKSQNDA